MADQLLYELSSSVQLDSEPFIRKDVIYINDMNNGAYGSTNQIQIDASSISNSGMWNSMSEAYLEIPLVMVLSGVGTTGTVDITNSAFVAGLKGGFHHLIDSMSVQLNNTTIIQQTRLNNIHAQFRYVSQASLQDVALNGPTNFIIPDSTDSWKYSTTNGSQNNSAIPVLGTVNVGVTGTAFNEGFYSRNKITSFNIGSTGGRGAQLITDESKNSQIAKTWTKQISATARAWYIMAQIRLKDLHPYFATVPLMKNAYYKIYLNLNQASCTFTASGTGYTIAPNNINVLGGGTMPFMLTNPSVGVTGMGLADGQDYTISLSVRSPYLQSQSSIALLATNGQISSCRLYVPCYVMDPTKEKNYLESNGREKEIKYSDIYQYNYSFGASSPYNQLISNGISKLKSVLVVPFFDKVPGSAGCAGVVAYQSPLASEPATTSPLIASLQTEYNVQISGINAYQTNIKYGYEHYLQELNQTGLNGNLTTGLCSSLISMESFMNNYGYLYTDCTRRLGSAFDAPASVQLIGNNSALVGVNFVVFLEFERSIKVDLFTGNVIQA